MFDNDKISQTKMTPKRSRIIIYLAVSIGMIIVLLVISNLATPKAPADSGTVLSAVSLVEKPTLPSKTETVCLDPGHGGKDIGASYGKISEADINLKVALQAKSLLEADGYRVYLTRSDDSSVAKKARVNYCNSVKANILISIHHNSYNSDHTVNYGTALYYKDSDELLASSILNSTSSKLSIKSQGISKFNDSLMSTAQMPAAISEAFFITDKSEYSRLTASDSTSLTDEAQGITTGIENYFNHPDQIQTSVSSDSLIIDRADLGD